MLVETPKLTSPGAGTGKVTPLMLGVALAIPEVASDAEQASVTLALCQLPSGLAQEFCCGGTESMFTCVVK